MSYRIEARFAKNDTPFMVRVVDTRDEAATVADDYRAQGFPRVKVVNTALTNAKIAKATDAELAARVKELFHGAEEKGGLTRKMWGEYHRIVEELGRRVARQVMGVA